LRILKHAFNYPGTQTSGSGSQKRILSARQGIGAWLWKRIHSVSTEPRLILVDRISIAPRQTLSLIEADGHTFLVATSSEGAPSFYPLKVVARSRTPKKPVTAGVN
jgi:hypothetical protein